MAKVQSDSFLKEMHRHDSEAIQSQFLAQHNLGAWNLLSHRHPSNVTRGAHYKLRGSQLNINALNRVLQVDPIEQTVLVEPRVTMQQLAKAVLPYGNVVPVLPEFKGITVGGAILGTGLESASHRFGLFSDQSLSYEILLGDGTIVKASPQEHPDLFYGLVGSYGSLGILLSVELKLIPAQPFVRLDYHSFDHISKAIAHLFQQNQCDFLEGIVFSKDCIIIVEGRYLTMEESQNMDQGFSQKYPWSPWFYQHIHEKLSQKNTSEKMPLSDYLFRHDRGAFWIGSYGTEWFALPRYFLESRLSLPVLSRLLPKNSWKNSPNEPGFWYRLLLGWAMSSHRLYTWLHAHSEEWVQKRCIIQDFCIPIERSAAFIEKVLDEIGVTPLWLCPVASTSTPQIFSPHFHPQTNRLVNVGVYGIPRPPQNALECISLLEEWTKQAGGRKMLYSYSRYTPEQFWEIYPKNAYDNLRKTYHAEAWTSIDAKVLSST